MKKFAVFVIIVAIYWLVVYILVLRSEIDRLQSGHVSSTPAAHNAAIATTARSLDDFLRLIDRCAERHWWLNEEERLRRPNAWADFRPGIDSVVYAVDQALRLYQLDVRDLCVSLRRQDPSRTSVDQQDIYSGRIINNMVTIDRSLAQSEAGTEFIYLERPPTDPAVVVIEIRFSLADKSPLLSMARYLAGGTDKQFA